jgi:CheY-like chemotaxis protein
MDWKKLNCVLVVDDDRVSNYVTEKVLQSQAISTMINTVSDGQSAIEYIKYQCAEDDFACPDLILLDINMRLVDGIEFVRQYRKLNIKHPCVIVILSTLPLKEDQKQDLVDLGVRDFIVKPLNADKLLGIMEKYFSSEACC